jgi:hypothetical protein
MSISNRRLSNELTDHMDKMQRGLVKSRRIPVLMELHSLGFDLSGALHESMSRGFHDVSRALLDLQVTITETAEYAAAHRGSEAFQLLCAYHRPGRGALKSAITRNDVSMIERITDGGLWITHDDYTYVNRLIPTDSFDTHHEMLRVMVARTQSQDLTRRAMDVIARYAKPATLIEAVHRTKNVRSTLITSALASGASGNVVALREEGIKVSAWTINRYVKTAYLTSYNVRPSSETIANLLGFYHEDRPRGLHGRICEAIVHAFIGMGSLHSDNARRGLALVSACARPEARAQLMRYVESWIDDRNLHAYPPMPHAQQEDLRQECSRCFAVGDTLTPQPTIDESPEP